MKKVKTIENTRDGEDIFEKVTERRTKIVKEIEEYLVSCVIKA